MTHIRLALRSDDPPDVRAANIMAYCGMTEGDPSQLLAIMRRISECLAAYQAVDREARK